MRRALSSVAKRSLHARSISSHANLPRVQITTLPNKVRIATEDVPGHFPGVGLFVDAGSRYESPDNAGVSHFLDRMAFKSTHARSDLEMSSAIHAFGGQIQCSSSREAIMYQSYHFENATPLALSVIADTVRNPAFHAEEIEAQKDATNYEIGEISCKPEMILPEILHQVAYGGKDLGNPLLCPAERVGLIDANMLRKFMEKWFTPDRIVIAGAGVRHEELVELADKHFSSMKGESVTKPQQTFQPSATVRQGYVPPHLLPSSSSPYSSLYKSFSRAASCLYPQPSTADLMQRESLPVSSYTGGHLFLPESQPEFNHIYLAWEGPGVRSPDIYALATMQMLLGGGNSFSAGGPGKGMFTRLYHYILNQHSHVDHCQAFHHIYSDSSLVGISTSFLPVSSPRHGGSPVQILPYIVHQMSLLMHVPVGSAELEKAKNQLKSSLVMALESRAVEVEDLGRQILVHNRKIPVSEMCNRIDEVTADDILRVSHKVFGPESAKPATVLVNGKDDIGDWKTVFKKYGVGGA